MRCFFEKSRPFHSEKLYLISSSGAESTRGRSAHKLRSATVLDRVQVAELQHGFLSFENESKRHEPKLNACDSRICMLTLAGGLESGIDRLALQGEHSEYTLVDSAKRFLTDKTFQRFYPEREFAQG